jgi:hypothetical protein
MRFTASMEIAEGTGATVASAAGLVFTDGNGFGTRRQ